MVEVEVFMDRGSCRGMPGDFDVALGLLQRMEFKDDDWDAWMHVADCHFALGAWDEARGVYERVWLLKSDCGEAYAFASLCARKRGDDQREAQLADKATRRGCGPMLELLRERDRRGELGRGVLAPIPRWHRCSQ
jgi:hypothetical protein